jgi:hypothetical protein
VFSTGGEEPCLTVWLFTQHGISSSALNVYMEGSTTIIQLPLDLSARILVDDHTTHIETADEKIRAFLRDVVLHDIVQLA